MMPRLQAEGSLRELSVVSFPHWGGDSKNPKTAARQAKMRRERYVRDLRRMSNPDADPWAGYELIETGEEMKRWFAKQGLNVREDGTVT